MGTNVKFIIQSNLENGKAAAKILSTWEELCVSLFMKNVLDSSVFSFQRKYFRNTKMMVTLTFKGGNKIDLYWLPIFIRNLCTNSSNN